ncbi:MAG: hypothetical protein AAF788_03890 [Pseudomonadota bacterium]
MQTSLTFAIDNRLPEILDRVRQLFPGSTRPAPATNPLDQLLYAVLAQGLSSAAATASFRRLRMVFPRLSDLRDAQASEIAELLVGLPAGPLKALALIEIVKRVEEAFGALSLDALARIDSEMARRFLTRLPRVTEEIAASVLAFTGFERPVLSVDSDTARPLRRLGLAEPGAPLSALPRQLIERSPADWGHDRFADLSRGLRRVSDRWCHQGRPDCGSCPLASLCPSAEKPAKKAQILSFASALQKRREDAA